MGYHSPLKTRPPKKSFGRQNQNQNEASRKEPIHTTYRIHQTVEQKLSWLYFCSPRNAKKNDSLADTRPQH